MAHATCTSSMAAEMVTNLNTTFPGMSPPFNDNGSYTALSKAVCDNVTGGGGISSVSVVTSNGFAGTVANPTTTPAITLSTTITGLLKGNGTTISSQAVGNLTDVGTDGIVVTGGTGSVLGSGTSIAQSQSSSSQNGYLSSGDWSTFNGKQSSGNYITALTGDVTASGPGGVASTLATVNSNTGSFGSSTAIPSFTVNGKGLITAASTNAVIVPAGTLTGTTLASNVVTSSLTALGTVGTGTWQASPVGFLYGGTNATSASQAFINLSPLTTAGDLIFENATPTPDRLPIGSTGNVLTVSGGLPVWAPPTASGTVTSVSIVSANGLTGTVATATTTPAITLSTSITGILQGNGTAISAASTTGSGSVVLATSPTLVTPALGTPSALVGTNISGTASSLTAGNINATSNSTLTTLSALSLPTSQLSGSISLTSQVSGTLPIANGGTNGITAAAGFNNLNPMTTTGDVIYEASAGTAARLGIGSTGNILTVSGGLPIWAPNTAATFTVPTIQRFTSSSGTYTTPTSPKTPLYLRILMVGGGGGGGGNGGAPGNGGSGTPSTFGTSLLTANGGGGGQTAVVAQIGGIGGTATVSSPAIQIAAFQGTEGLGGAVQANATGGAGGSSPFGGASSGSPGPAVGTPHTPIANSGSGGGGAGGGAAQSSGGGAAGGYIEAIVPSPSSTYSYGVGAAGAAGTAGSAGFAGAPGAAGYIEVTEYYQ